MSPDMAARYERDLAFAQKRIRYFLEDGSGCPDLTTLLRWCDKQGIAPEMSSRALAVMQASGVVRIDGDRCVWLVMLPITEETAVPITAETLPDERVTK